MSSLPRSHLAVSFHVWTAADPCMFHYTSSVSFTDLINVARHRPEAQGSSLYPNEVASDFAFIPFGGGQRKCVGDQFALMEATVILAMLLKCAPSADLTSIFNCLSSVALDMLLNCRPFCLNNAIRIMFRSDSCGGVSSAVTVRDMSSSLPNCL